MPVWFLVFPSSCGRKIPSDHAQSGLLFLGGFPKHDLIAKGEEEFEPEIRRLHSQSIHLGPSPRKRDRLFKISLLSFTRRESNGCSFSLFISLAPSSSFPSSSSKLSRSVGTREGRKVPPLCFFPVRKIPTGSRTMVACDFPNFHSATVEFRTSLLLPPSKTKGGE